MRVAVLQYAAGDDKAAARERLTSLVREAAGVGARLVVAPEAAMHDFGPPDRSLALVAEPLDGLFVATVADAARATGATVLAGMFERADGERAYNTVVAVGPDGLLGAYRKLHLFDALGWRESDRLLPGDTGPLVVTVDDLRVGILTCYDLRFPELARALCDRGATALAVPAAWVAGPLKEDQWTTLVRARAIESTAYVLAAGQPPPTYCGRSAIVDPAGTVLAALGDGEGVVVSEATADRVAEVRRRVPSLEHRRWAVVPR